MSTKWFSSTIFCLAVAGAISLHPQPALAQGSDCKIDWTKLNLNPQQNQHIQQLEGQWSKDYNTIKPAIVEDQRKLTKMLEVHDSDPVEIMALQQSIARKKEQLNQLATTNYLQKRKVLNETQQHSLEQMIRQAVAERQRQINPGAQTEVVPDRIQNLMQKVRNIWPSQGN